jgi:Peptidase family M23
VALSGTIDERLIALAVVLQSSSAFRNPNSTKGDVCVSILALFLLATIPAANVQPPSGGEGFGPERFADEMTPRIEARLLAAQAQGADRLRAQGKLPTTTLRAPTIANMLWPLAPRPGVGVDWIGVSNFVDLNAAFPHQILDYSCGARSYDTNTGYNHRGTDLFTWPFAWTLQDQGAVDAVAAAPGTIIAKVDGNFDRECTGQTDTPNYVFVQHTDGTVAWYLHLKNGSLTSKVVGNTVAAGEFLGKVGSSGASTGPHLHFELRASSAGNAAVIDPFNGTCNAIASSWATQRPYFDSKINRLLTHNLPPQFPNCPATTETPNIATDFLPGQAVIFAAYYRDQRHGQVTNFRILRPDNSVFQSWSFDSQSASGSSAHYAASYWYWTYTLPANAPAGTWTFESTFQSETKTASFVVGDALFRNGFEP